jgi:hypothetical protein
MMARVQSRTLRERSLNPAAFAAAIGRGLTDHARDRHPPDTQMRGRCSDPPPRAQTHALSPVERLLRHAELAADLRDHLARRLLRQGVGDLLFRERRLLHANLQVG